MITRLPKQIFLTGCALLCSSVLSAKAQSSALGDFESNGDVGLPKVTGSSAFDPGTREYTVTGAGTDLWAATDQFQFLWRKLKGDFTLSARMEFAGPGSHEKRKAGWMVRSSLDTDSAYADCAEHGNGETCLQFRRAKGAKTEEIILNITNADVLQFERRGKNFIISAARHGETFTHAELTNFDLGEEVYAGLWVCSHNAEVPEKVIFRDVHIIRFPVMGVDSAETPLDLSSSMQPVATSIRPDELLVNGNFTDGTNHWVLELNGAASGRAESKPALSRATRSTSWP